MEPTGLNAIFNFFLHLLFCCLLSPPQRKRDKGDSNWTYVAVGQTHTHTYPDGFHLTGPATPPAATQTHTRTQILKGNNNKSWANNVPPVQVTFLGLSLSSCRSAGGRNFGNTLLVLYKQFKRYTAYFCLLFCSVCRIMLN